MRLPINLSKNQAIFFGGILLVLIIFGLILSGILPGRQEKKGGEEIELYFWGISDKQVYEKAISQFCNSYPGLRINYKEFDSSSYEEKLVNALAAGKGPDIFVFHNSWLAKHFDKVSPLDKKKLGLSSLGTLFPKVVEQDFAPFGTIYALPLYLDTLAFIYNPDFFDQAKVATLPQTWSELKEVIPQLRKLDKTGKLDKAAIAIGGSNESIGNASDILALLMLQNGVEMTDKDWARATFSQARGINVLEFYTSFANPLNSNYSWDELLGDSSNIFSQGKVGAIFDYSSAISEIEQKNPLIEAAASPMLQLDPENEINLANYWGLTVSKSSFYPALSWDFIIFSTTNQENAENYLKNTKKPPALRSLIKKYLNQEGFSVFCQQALTARSWLVPDSNQTKEIFSQAIESVITGRLTARQALGQAQKKVTRLINQSSF